MSADDYLALSEPGRAQTRVLGSRFLGHALPVLLPEDTQRLLEAERKAHHDATHWCWAWRIGVGQDRREKSSDAGEPHGTAGLPILQEIVKREITDCLVIVTRWFGGTKLGKGNLARTYAECAGLALDAAVVIKKQLLMDLMVTCAADDQTLVYAIARRFHVKLRSQPEANDVAFMLSVPLSLTMDLQKALIEEGRGRLHVKEERS
jgi:uncharacterized YigZ family protein